MPSLFPSVIGTRHKVIHIVDNFTGSNAVYIVNERDIVVASVEVFNPKHLDTYWDCALVIADALEGFADKPYVLRTRTNV